MSDRRAVCGFGAAERRMELRAAKAEAAREAATAEMAREAAKS